MMDQCRMWRTEGIVLECVKIGQYISDIQNTIVVKQMQRQAMYLKTRIYCNYSHNLQTKHMWGECGILQSAEERHNHHQALCIWLQNYSIACDEQITPVILMVHLHPHIAGRMVRRWVWNATTHWGGRKRVIHCQSLWGSIQAVRAVLNTLVYVIKTRVVADVLVQTWIRRSVNCDGLVVSLLVI